MNVSTLCHFVSGTSFYRKGEESEGIDSHERTGMCGRLKKHTEGVGQHAILQMKLYL